ncbi:MAG: Gfo/Idh/MocA family oxidoreductase, partial [Planctomycetes bacterium]|nr:Gfo/Idh/MocA family oxidoreductase [Planctomycetota bacterium]
MKDISAAIIGSGFMGGVHTETLRRLGVGVAGILDVSPQRSEAARAALDLPRAYGSYEEVLGDASVAAVHLCVPNALHYDMARRALEAGKHVLCEKPLAMNTAETRTLADLAAARNRAAGVCYTVRYYPLNVHVRQRIRNGDVGRIYAVNGSYVQDWLLYDTDYNWRVLADQGGELRAVADIGTHWMDLVTSMTGLEVEAVLADLATFHPVRNRPLGEVETFSGKLGGQQA